MKNIHARFFFFLAAICCMMAARGADNSQSDFHGLVQTLYNFQPRTLDSAGLTEKSARLDSFWAGVKGDRAKNLPLLRRELDDPSNSAFFAYDGAKLLLSLSNEPADRMLALRSIPRADLRDIQPADYLRTVQRLAAQGYDTREAAFHILVEPEFKAIIPQHALTLGQNYSLIYMLFPLPEETYLPDLAARLTADLPPASQKSVLLALWYTASPLGRRTIRQCADNRAMPDATRAYARELMARSTSSLLAVSFSSDATLRKERRELMGRPISDESLIEFERLTAKLRPGKAD